MIMQFSHRPAAFVDRDGTLIEDVHYIKNPADVVVPESVISGLQLLRQANFLLIMISNQSGLSRGYFTQDELASVHARMSLILEENFIELDGFYYCAHLPGSCSCRKPETGMLEEAYKDFDIDLSHSCMIGDNDCDVQMAKNFGIAGYLLESKRQTDHSLATRVCKDFLEAAELAVARLN